MRSVNDVTKSLGYDFDKACPIQSIKIVYAYKNGTVKKFDNITDAKKFSSITEVVDDPKSKARWTAWWKIRLEQQAHVNDILEKELRLEYSHLSDQVYNLCYDEAYDRGHSGGFDEVAAIMESVVAFAEDIMKAKQ